MSKSENINQSESELREEYLAILRFEIMTSGNDLQKWIKWIAVDEINDSIYGYSIKPSIRKTQDLDGRYFGVWDLSDEYRNDSVKPNDKGRRGYTLLYLGKDFSKYWRVSLVSIEELFDD